MPRRFALVLALWALTIAPAHALFADIDALTQLLRQSRAPTELELLAERLARQSPGTTFRDVDPMAWYAPYVATMVRRSIVSGDLDAAGTPKGTFRPEDDVTVAEALKIAFRAARIDPSPCTGELLSIQAQTHWARAYVLCAQGLGVRVLADNAFLDRPISRAEVLSLIDDVFGDTVEAVPSPFRDSAEHRYAQDIAYNAHLQIISGDTDRRGQATGFFRPDDPLRRAEMVKMVALKIEREGF